MLVTGHRSLFSPPANMLKNFYVEILDSQRRVILHDIWNLPTQRQIANESFYVKVNPCHNFNLAHILHKRPTYEFSLKLAFKDSILSGNGESITMGPRKASKMKKTDKDHINNKIMTVSISTEMRFNKKDEVQGDSKWSLKSLQIMGQCYFCETRTV